MTKPEGPDQDGELRQRAEVLARLKPLSPVMDASPLAPEEIQRTLHDLRVHQIELEMQNEELRRLQVELDHSRTRYFDLYDLAPIGYFTLNSQGQILEANFTGSEMLGVARSALVNQPLSRFILSADQDLFYLARHKLYETRAPQIVDLRMVKAGGGSIWVRLKAAVEPDGGAESVARLVLNDITEHKKMEMLVHQSELMDTLGILAGGVAHGMNNVLGAILGLASVHAEIEPPDSSAQQAFLTIEKACDRGGQLVRSLMDFARQGISEEKELDLNELLRNEIRMIIRSTYSRVRLELDLAEDLAPIRGDASALSHALINLCTNATDAMPEDGTLTLRTRNVNSGWIEVQVEDTGTGMPAEVLAESLTPFYTTKPEGKGTGMGLSIAQSTVLAHHGELELVSQPGLGTRVLLRFPTCLPSSRAPKAPLGPMLEPSSLSLKVLVVDDDDLVQSSMQVILKMLGHTVTIASSGEEALVELEVGSEPDVVFLDMNMPGLGGAGTLPILRALRPTLPVVIATGRSDQVVRDLVQAYPLVTQLPKPFGIKELRQHLEQFGRK